MSIKGQAAARAAGRWPDGQAAARPEGAASTEPAASIAAGRAHGIAGAGLTSPAPAHPTTGKVAATRGGVTWGDVGDAVATYGGVIAVFGGLWVLLIYLLTRSAG